MQNDIGRLLEEAAGTTSHGPDFPQIYRRGRRRMWGGWLGASMATLALIAVAASVVTSLPAAPSHRTVTAGGGAPDLASLEGRILLAGIEDAEDRDNPGAKDFYVSNPDGTDRRRVFHDVPITGWQGVALAPDGTRLVFPMEVSHDDWELFVAQADGTGLRQLTDGPGSVLGPAWSPDGSRIAFVRSDFSDDRGEIWVMSSDGTELRSLGTQPYAADLTFSPDSDLLAYSRSVGADHNNQIFVLNVRSREATRLTHTDSSSSDTNPSWSPDGSRIAFNRNIDDNDATGGDIYVMSSDGSQVEAVVVGGNAPVWSPDGSHIVFMRFVNAEGGWKMRTLVVSAEGGVPESFGPKYDFVIPLDWHP